MNTEKTPGGARLHGSYPKAKGQGIPWFVILDGDGKEVADSMGPKGNIGCPDTDEEIAVWTDLLKRVRKALTDEDLEALKSSRRADREERKKK